MKKELVIHFDKIWESYDRWYDDHPALYRSELAALKAATGGEKVLDIGGRMGLEIGVGTGRFAAPLGIPFGLDPAFQMLRAAKKRGLAVIQGMGENLPFRDACLDFVLIVFVLEFVDDLKGFLAEAVRTLRAGGALVLGFIDRDSPWGKYYGREASHRDHFHPPLPQELRIDLQDLGMEFQCAFQTLFHPPPDVAEEETPRPGFGEGGFVVVRAVKTSLS